MKELLVKVDGQKTVKVMEFDEAWVSILAPYATNIARKYSLSENSFFDDLIQAQMIEAWNAYESYNIEHECLFFTHANYYIRRAINQFFRAKNTQKRGNGESALSLDMEYGNEDDSILSYLKTDEDISLNYEIHELCETILGKYVTDEISADMIKVIADHSNYSYQWFATQYGLTRQGAREKVKRFQKKIIKVEKEKWVMA